jgi:N-methylhydantoinase B
MEQLEQLDAVELEIYRQLFSSVAEEMGAVLMRSAFSPNIKERRDFSCAVFDADAEMVAQAAHIPVHLGSTPMSVRAAIDGVEMATDGHAILNDPYAGGTHLPDITFVSPVTGPDGQTRFYVANRAHHADVGGKSPGSLPMSRHIDEEGVRISPTAWSEDVRQQILDATRTPEERIGDLQAQLAANRRGRERLQSYMRRRGAEAWRAAGDLQRHSERYMRRALAEMPDGCWSFEDVMEDDGFGHRDLPIRSEVELAGDEVAVRFPGTAHQCEGPINAPRSVTVSAVLYVFRCLAPEEMPSNGGYMRPISVETESGTLVHAEYPAPVAAGNVETSQRITDVVLGALARGVPDRIPAASCGTMNNVMIGTDRGADGSDVTYYETIAGGSGGGPTAPGASGVQTHMTNTYNTPVEALEHEYPFRVTEYALRSGSGGDGALAGGNGVRRTYEMLEEVSVTLMTERRRRAPYGLCGGGAGGTGRNLKIEAGETEEADMLPAKCTVELQQGDRLSIETPGGGGWGEAVGGASQTDEHPD